MRCARVGAAIAGLTACDALPLAPSSVDTYLHGFVQDTVFRLVSGALVEIVDGRRAGARTTSSDRGVFEFTGGPNGPVTLRVSRDGFVSTTITTAWSTNPNEQTRVILKSVESPLEIEPGAYTMTLISDPSASGWGGADCAGFPPDLLRRTYEASISPATQFDGFLVRFTSPTLIKLPAP